LVQKPFACSWLNTFFLFQKDSRYLLEFLERKKIWALNKIKITNKDHTKNLEEQAKKSTVEAKFITWNNFFAT
jgi:hypothetical protein